MKWAALIAWVITAGGGFVLLGLWLKGGGMRQAGVPGRVIRAPLILGHFALAATGLVLWIIYVAADSDALAWIAFALLLVVALLGFTMFALWLQQRRTPAVASAPLGPGTTETASGGSQGSAERRFPVPIVLAHGALAATTLVLVLLAAAGVGD
jgi:hypothetical protein